MKDESKNAPVPMRMISSSSFRAAMSEGRAGEKERRRRGGGGRGGRADRAGIDVELIRLPDESISMPPRRLPYRDGEVTAASYDKSQVRRWSTFEREDYRIA